MYSLITSHSQFFYVNWEWPGNEASKGMFSHLSIRRQCDVLIVSIASVLDHQHWCILHGAHQEHISAEGGETLIIINEQVSYRHRLLQKIRLTPTSSSMVKPASHAPPNSTTANSSPSTPRISYPNSPTLS